MHEAPPPPLQRARGDARAASGRLKAHLLSQIQPRLLYMQTVICRIHPVATREQSPARLLPARPFWRTGAGSDHGLPTPTPRLLSYQLT
jgi:hypothetical protein